MMSATDVLQVIDALQGSGIAVWLDGGWGVDALVEKQTREHDDLDLVVALEQSNAVVARLRRLGYAMTVDERPTRVVVAASGGRQIDLHTVTFDEGGGGVQRLQDGRSYRYPPQGFTARGKVGERVLPCLTPEVQIECHLGYKPTDVDRHDVSLLIERFNLPRPQGY